jgi:hypothetical protein
MLLLCYFLLLLYRPCCYDASTIVLLMLPLHTDAKKDSVDMLCICYCCYCWCCHDTSLLQLMLLLLLLLMLMLVCHESCWCSCYCNCYTAMLVLLCCCCCCCLLVFLLLRCFYAVVLAISADTLLVQPVLLQANVSLEIYLCG